MGIIKLQRLYSKLKLRLKSKIFLENPINKHNTIMHSIKGLKLESETKAKRSLLCHYYCQETIFEKMMSLLKTSAFEMNRLNTQ